MDYAEQQSRAQQLQEIEAFKLAKLWRILAQDHDRVTQRVVIANGVEWQGELQDRVFIYSTHAPEIPATVPVLLLDADHDPLIGAATLPTNRRTALLPSFNAEVIQVRDTACSKNKLLGRKGDQKGLDAAARRRQQIITLARHEAAQGRRVLIGTYKPVADLLRAELARRPASGGALRLDPWPRQMEGLRHRDRGRPRAAAAAGGREHRPVPVRRRPRAAAADRRTMSRRCAGT